MSFISSNSHIRRAGFISTTTIAAIGKKIEDYTESVFKFKQSSDDLVTHVSIRCLEDHRCLIYLLDCLYFRLSISILEILQSSLTNTPSKSNPKSSTVNQRSFCRWFVVI